MYGKQPDPDIANDVRSQVISDNDQFTGQPAFAVQPDGRLNVAGLRSDGDVWSRTQVERSGTAWQPWVNVGASLVSSPTVGKLADGTLVEFGVDTDGRLWRLAQKGPNAAFGSWLSLGDADLAAPPTVAVIRDGLQLFARDLTGAVRTATYYPWGSCPSGSTSAGQAARASPPW